MGAEHECGASRFVQRATQFHDLVGMVMGAQKKLPFLLPPRGGRLQPVESAAVAVRIAASHFWLLPPVGV